MLWMDMSLKLLAYMPEPRYESSENTKEPLMPMKYNT